MMSINLAICVLCEVFIRGISIHTIPRKSRRHHNVHHLPDAQILSDQIAELPSMVVSKAGSATHHRADGRGERSPLTEIGYQHVAVLKSDEEMAKFIRRLLDSYGKVVGSEGDLAGFVPFYSGTANVQSLEQLQAELLQSPWAVNRTSSREVPVVEESPTESNSLAEEDIRRWGTKQDELETNSDAAESYPFEYQAARKESLSTIDKVHEPNLKRSQRIGNHERRPEPKATPAHVRTGSLFGRKSDAQKLAGRVLHIHAQDVISARQYAGGVKLAQKSLHSHAQHRSSNKEEFGSFFDDFDADSDHLHGPREEENIGKNTKFKSKGVDRPLSYEDAMRKQKKNRQNQTKVERPHLHERATREKKTNGKKDTKQKQSKVDEPHLQAKLTKQERMYEKLEEQKQEEVEDPRQKVTSDEKSRQNHEKVEEYLQGMTNGEKVIEEKGLKQRQNKTEEPPSHAKLTSEEIAIEEKESKLKQKEVAEIPRPEPKLTGQSVPSDGLKRKEKEEDDQSKESQKRNPATFRTRVSGWVRNMVR